MQGGRKMIKYKRHIIDMMAEKGITTYLIEWFKEHGLYLSER